jgi:sigma-B regulation protein RsbU (phosphoserine phosphatase)
LSSTDLFEAAACGLARTTGDGTFLNVNRRFCEWVGYSSQELCGQRKLQELLTMGGRIFHQTHWHPLLQMQGSVAEVKLEILHRDGHPLPMLIDAVRRNSDDHIVHDLAFYIVRDRDKYEREILQSRKRLQDLVDQSARLQREAKDRALFAEQMMGIVSHDLRNPLSTIQMGATLLSGGDPSSNQLRVLGRITRAAERANRLISDLLDFTQARIGTGISVSIQRIDVSKTIRDVAEELRLAYPGRSLLHKHKGAPHGWADADRLAQLVGNLVSNAMDYGSTDRPVTLISEVEPGGACSISVHNEGTPIPLEAQALLFRPMVKGAVESRAERSVGLGLFIVAEISKAHGGSVSVSSGQGGTTFEVLLPGGLVEGKSQN